MVRHTASLSMSDSMKALAGMKSCLVGEKPESWSLRANARPAKLMMNFAEYQNLQTILGISSSKQTVAMYPALNYSLLNMNNED
jgi:hypothetical protein